MSKRQLLIPAASFERVEQRLSVFSSEIDAILWSSNGLTAPDGSSIEPSEFKPEIGWIPIDVLFSGEFLAFVDSLLEPGSLKWVQSCLAGADAPPLQRILNSGIRLSNSDSPNAGVAEYVMSAILNVVHEWPKRRDAQWNKEWVQEGWSEINKQTWLIIGFGSIGGELAKRARPFGVHIIGARRTQVSDERADQMVSMEEVFEVLPSADVVIIACPLTNETKGLVDRNFLSHMNRNSLLVNVARGPVVNTSDLLHMLDSKELAGAILDVFDVEPLETASPLWDHEKITLTSHIAGAGSGITMRGDDVFIEQLGAYLAGRKLRLEISA
ncbi:MAG TPA: hypothetical protein DCY36_10575 [Acidimicrobiaceae bacterium]|jgi:phosphoglycerate dehydrogenase-like enzyme|nr:D-2-hydroxyacid dehydrogenase [Acidimicrobiales bacterium]HAA66263.1 hypothetical protein [Acidimicrobiaceae bacterium]HAY66463.1 hypothetical protein [Acidimicrobiaceae bacterium]HCK74829.1 hypothetical protein [Acidimicrobiaceae bacterium]|tara:strand:- start:7986 stop:8966 length:981 start_codon:yes stop_codon:yes gene_type:complete